VQDLFSRLDYLQREVIKPSDKEMEATHKYDQLMKAGANIHHKDLINGAKKDMEDFYNEMANKVRDELKAQ